VCFLDGGELVGDGDCRAVRADIVERLLYDFLGSRIQCAGRFIEEQDWWIGDDASSDSDSLLLTWIDVVSSWVTGQRLLLMFQWLMRTNRSA